MITLNGIVKRYGSQEVLRGVTMSVARGEVCVLLGPSGGGKSTLLRTINGLETFDEGSIDVSGTQLIGGDIASREAALLKIRRKVGMVFQQFNLLPTLTAEENITFPLDLAGRKPDSAWMTHVVNTVGLSDRLHHKPSELSGGQQQRVAVARALVERPEIIFADEPTGNLDSTSSSEILSFMEGAVKEFGQTVVMVTHDPVAASHASRVLFLADGRIVDELMAPTRDSVLDRMRNLGD